MYEYVTILWYQGNRLFRCTIMLRHGLLERRPRVCSNHNLVVHDRANKLVVVKCVNEVLYITLSNPRNVV